jgi:hypothetical protein
MNEPSSGLSSGALFPSSLDATSPHPHRSLPGEASLQARTKYVRKSTANDMFSLEEWAPDPRPYLSDCLVRVGLVCFTPPFQLRSTNMERDCRCLTDEHLIRSQIPSQALFLSPEVITLTATFLRRITVKYPYKGSSSQANQPKFDHSCSYQNSCYLINTNKTTELWRVVEMGGLSKNITSYRLADCPPSSTR